MMMMPSSQSADSLKQSGGIP